MTTTDRILSRVTHFCNGDIQGLFKNKLEACARNVILSMNSLSHKLLGREYDNVISRNLT